MDVTEIRIKPAGGARSKLRAYCSVTFDQCFVVRDMKIIEGTHGLFVAMPSRKLADSCPSCGGKNHLRARFCNDCGGELAEDRAERDSDGRVQLHADVAHPIHSAYREELQSTVLAAYEAECGSRGDRAKAEEPNDYLDSDSDFDEPDEDVEPVEDVEPDEPAQPAEPLSADPRSESADDSDQDTKPASGPPPEEPGSTHPFGEGIL